MQCTRLVQSKRDVVMCLAGTGPWPQPKLNLQLTLVWQKYLANLHIITLSAVPSFTSDFTANKTWVGWRPYVRSLQLEHRWILWYFFINSDRVRQRLDYYVLTYFNVWYTQIKIKINTEVKLMLRKLYLAN